MISGGVLFFFFFASRRRHTRLRRDWSSDVCSSDLIVEQGQALEQATAWANKAERQSPTSITACKRLIQTARKEPMFVGMAYERDAFVRLFDSNDCKEGVQAFLEKRKPNWTNT